MPSAQRPGGPHQRGKPTREISVVHSFPVAPTTARLARTTARAACCTWRLGEVCDAVVLAVSELVGNVVRHGGGGRLVVRLAMTPRRLRLEVCDSDPHGPQLRTPPTDAEGGRGLWLISEVSTRWGVESDGDGKRVWVEIAL